MKKIIVATLLISVLSLAGCQSKGAPSGANSPSGSNAQTVTSRDNTKYNFQPVKPGTLPKLNESQKSEVNKKVDSTLKNVQDTLNNMQDTQDLNLDSTN